MLSKISEEFMGNMKNNIERNCLVLNTIKMNSSSYPSTTNANENMNRIMGAI